MPAPLQLNRFSTLALKAMVVLAASRERQAAGRLAAGLKASPAHLAKIMTRLSAAGLVEGRRGPGGGFRLSRPPERVTLSQVLQALIPETQDGCLWGRNGCGEGCLWGDLPSRLGRTLASNLEQVTLADLTAGKCQEKFRNAGTNTQIEVAQY